MLSLKFKNFDSKLSSKAIELFRAVLLDPNLNKAHFSWSEQGLIDELNHSSCLLVYDAEPGNEVPIAFILYRPLPEYFEIMVLATDPRFRNKGILFQSLNELANLAENNTNRLMLEVHSGNKAAIELYKKNNFKVIGTRRRYYQDGADALIMEKKLK